MSFLFFTSMATVWLTCAYVAKQYIAELPFWFVVVSVFFFAVPIAMMGIYTSAVNQTRMLSYFNTNGRVFKLYSGRLIRSILWVIWAFTSSFAMLLQFRTYSWKEWLTLALAIPTFWYIHKLCSRVLSSELKKRYVVSCFAIAWTRFFCTFFLVIVYAILLSLWGDGPSYSSLNAAMESRKITSPAIAGSALVQAVLPWISLVDGSKAYLVGGMKVISDVVPMLVMIIGSYIVFFNASVTFACFVIPVYEHRRIYGPLSDEDIPPPLSEMRVAVAAAIFTVVTLFIYVPLFAAIEEYLQTPRAKTIMEAPQNARILFEKIDEQFYKPGTRKAIEGLAKANALVKDKTAQAILTGQVDLAFNQIELNVDSYLDWYYSLTGEYMRLANLMIGEIESYMAEKLGEKLKLDDATKLVNAGKDTYLASRKAIYDELQRDVIEILAKNKVQVSDSDGMRIPNVSLSSLLVLPVHIDVVSMESRLVGGAAATGIGALMIGKIASKGMFQAAGKALAKVAASKAAGTATGAAIGGTVCSPIPFVGTVICGVVGGLLGGLFVDQVLLKLEEQISREDFKKEIVSSIHESRDNLKRDLFVPVTP